MLSWAPSGEQIFARLSCPGMLVVAETWFPGWQATVDGQDHEIQQVESALRGVRLDRGAHVVELRYRPWSVYLGALMSLSGLLGAVFLSRVRR